MMMTCREVMDFLAEYLADSISGSERAEFENHLAVCSDCDAHVRSSADAYRLSQLALCDLPDPSPSEVPDALLRDIVDLQNQPETFHSPYANHSETGGSPFSEVPIRADHRRQN